MYNHEIDTFIEAARTGSFSEAARNLYVSKAAIAQQINHLEHKLNLKLFIRTTHGIRLTVAGEAFLPRAKQIVALCQDIQDTLSQYQPHLIVGSGYLNKQTLLHRIWHQKPRHHVQLTFQEILDYNHLPANIDLLEMVQSKEPIEKQGFRFVSLQTVPYVLALPAKDLLAQKKVVTLSDLKGKAVALPAASITDDFKDFQASAPKYGILLKDYLILDRARINEFQFNHDAFLIPEPLADLCQPYAIKKIGWPMTAEYGFYYRTNASDVLKTFLKMI